MPIRDGAVPTRRCIQVLAALVLDREGRARIQEAVRPIGAARFFERAEDLVAGLDDPDIRTVLLEPYDRDGRSLIATVRALHEGYPSLAILAYGAMRPGMMAEAVGLLRAGAHDVVIRGHDDEGVVLRTALERAAGRCTAELVLRELAPHIPESVRPAVQACLESPSKVSNVTELARTLGVHRKTLVNRLRVAGLPPPSELIGWCRVLHVSRLLEDPGRGIEEIALRLDFPSATALRNMLRRYTGLRPTTIRERGGLGHVLPQCVRALRAGGYRYAARRQG